MSFLGIDLGGTNVKGIVIDGGGTTLAHGSRPTPRSGPDDVVAAMVALGRELAGGGRLDLQVRPAGAQAGPLAHHRAQAQDQADGHLVG